MVSNFTPLFSQSGFLQTVALSTVNFTNQEQATFTKLQNAPKNLAVWPLQINQIENYVLGSDLAIQLPNETATSFTSYYVNSKSNGDYYWAGYASNGSHFRVAKFQTGYTGNIFFANTGNNYGISSISGQKNVLIKIAPSVFSDSDCGGCSNDDEDVDDEVTDRSGCDNNNIRILVLFSANSGSSTGLNPVVVANTIVAELNASTVASGMTATQTSFTLANALLLPGFIETFNIHNDLNSYSSSTIAKNIRDANYADLVILLTDNSHTDAVGEAKGISVFNKNAFCIAEITPAAFGFTGTHELGHLIGTRHQRCSDCKSGGIFGGCDVLTNHHGVDIGNGTFRTIMRQNGCSGTRVGIWSNDNGVTFGGFSTGNYFNKNAHKIKKRAAKVSCFRGTPQGTPFVDAGVYLKAPHSVCFEENQIPLSVTFDATIFQPPVTFQWQYSATGLAPWANLSINSNFTLTGVNNLPAIFYIRVTLSDAAGNVISDQVKITKQDCLNGNSNDRVASEMDLPRIVKVFPNPNDGSFWVSGINESAFILTVKDITGRIVHIKKFIETCTVPIFVETQNLPVGVYLISLDGENTHFNTKIIKQ